MKILILGGTGAMGIELIKKIDDGKNQIYVTSRKKYSNSNNVTYIQGDSHDVDFIKKLFKEKKEFDCIVDFMYYQCEEFKKIYKIISNNTKHYIFLSSARVYSNCDEFINENTQLLMDSMIDEEYLKQNEYALEKNREEEYIRNYQNKNWTIIRPYITYNFNRIQFGAYEKEQWLYRVLNGKKVAIQKDMFYKYTTLSYAGDVSYYISKLIGNEKAYGEIIQIMDNNSKIKWKDVYDIYKSVLNENNIKFEVELVEHKESDLLGINMYQLKYDRYYNRRFYSLKLEEIIGEKVVFESIDVKLKECLRKYLKNSKNESLELDATFNGIMDKMTKEYTKLSSFKGKNNKIKYILARFTHYRQFKKLIKNKLNFKENVTEK